MSFVFGSPSSSGDSDTNPASDGVVTSESGRGTHGGSSDAKGPGCSGSGSDTIRLVTPDVPGNRIREETPLPSRRRRSLLPTLSSTFLLSSVTASECLPRFLGRCDFLGKGGRVGAFNCDEPVFFCFWRGVGRSSLLYLPVGSFGSREGVGSAGSKNGCEVIECNATRLAGSYHRFKTRAHNLNTLPRNQRLTICTRPEMRLLHSVDMNSGRE